jgi:hypothetical protein
MYRRVLGTFARARFDVAADGGVSVLTRWTVRRGPVPDGAAAVLYLTLEELATNELRETFHHWVRTVRLPVVATVADGEVVEAALGGPLAHRPAAALRAEREAATQATRRRRWARSPWRAPSGRRWRRRCAAPCARPRAR